MKKNDDNSIIDDDVIIDDATGEVCLKQKFRSVWSNPFGMIKQDLSNEFEDTFQEIEPYAIDPKTGKFLNDSSVPKIVSTGKVNVKEKIQSFAKEVDLYSILEKFAYSGDSALLNARPCDYGDISDMPDNLNDFALRVNAQLDKLTSLNPDLAKMVIDDKYTAQDIENKANEIAKARIDATNVEKGEGDK